MYSMMKTKVQILVPLLLAMTFLLGVFFPFPTSSYPPPAAAQEPVPPVSNETLEAFGLTLPSIQAASGPFDLGLSKTASASSVNSGDRITFTISITNSGNPAEYVFFYDDIPAQMKNVAYDFSKAAISDGQVIPTWLFTEIGSGETVYITITGILTSAPDIMVTNIATVNAWNATEETDTANNIDEADVDIRGYSPIRYIYLPMIFKSRLVYYETFDSGEPWAEYDADGCNRQTRDGKFQVDVDQSDRECLPFGPKESNRRYGEFEVTAYHSGDLSNAAYGIFINGAGGDDYYLFRIWPNDDCSTGGDWQLIRERDGDRDTLLRGYCEDDIKQGNQTNRLKIAHESDRTLSVYVNDTFLDSYSESSSKHLTGESTGVYVRSGDEDVRIKFDDFKIYRFD